MKKRLCYALLDPTGNITLLVETQVPPASQPLAAARLMAAEPDTEQVGFFSADPDGSLRLRMAGGEFCGNAAMSAAVLRALDTEIGAGSFSVRISGAAEPVAVSVSPLPGSAWRGTVAMPPPLSVERVSFPDTDPLPLVRLGGISHVILERAPEPARDEEAARIWCGLLGAEALGLLFLDRVRGTLTPLVYVPAAGTLCWETSCASGATAAAAWLSREAGRPLSLSLQQPGGVLETAVSPEGEISLTGTVTLRKRGFADVEFDA